MNIAIEQNVPALKRLSHHHFSRAVFGTGLHARGYPLSIQIEPTERCSIVTDQNPIWIQHRDYLEHEIVSEVASNFFVRDQELQYSLNNERGVTLSRVHPTRYHDGASNSYLLWPRTEVRNYCHFAVVASDSLTNDCLTDAILRLWLTESH